MKKRGLGALYDIFEDTSDKHLNDEKLARVAGAEAAGEDIERLYDSELAHIETCIQCAEAYSELVTIMQAATAEMSAAAAAINPLEAYTRLLLSDVEAQVGSLPALPNLIHTIAAFLPLSFTNLPADPSEIPPDLVGTILQASPQTKDAPLQIITAVTEAIRQNISMLAAYLSGRASNIWQRSLTVAGTEIQDKWHMLQLALAPQKVVPILGEGELGEERVLLSQNIRAVVPLHVEARADRLSTLTCRLVVRVDRPGLLDPAGRPIRITYAKQQEMAETDDSGIAHFDAVPIAALANLVISVQED